MTRTLSELAVMEMRMQEMQERAKVDPREYHGEITDKHRRFYLYELQCDVVIQSMRVLGHMMENHPHDLDNLDED